MIEAPVEALQFADAEMAVRVVVLTGEGRAFSSGGNLNKMGEAGGVTIGSRRRPVATMNGGVQRLPLLFESLEVPVSLPRSMGPAIGAGCDLACMCDLRPRGTEGASPGRGHVGQAAPRLPRTPGISSRFMP